MQPSYSIRELPSKSADRLQDRDILQDRWMVAQQDALSKWDVLSTRLLIGQRCCPVYVGMIATVACLC